jgi:aerobic carbon-monoxide dehydrogenase medium subunit
VIPVKFTYRLPATIEEASALLAGHAHAAVLAGGQSLIPSMTVRRTAPSMLVDIRKIGGLRGISKLPRKGGLRIGAATTLDEISGSPVVAATHEALAEAAGSVGDPQVRHRGTIGGALADGHPSGDLIAAAIALDATVNVSGPKGTRAIAAADLVTGPYATSLARGEIITSVDLPAAAARSGSAYLKIRHPGSGYAVCAVAAALTVGADGTVGSVRIAVTGAADAPVRLGAVEKAGVGKTVADAAAAAGKATTKAGLTYRSDLAASAEYRAHLASVLTERAVALAGERAGSA